jgi:hypothetical protein
MFINIVHNWFCCSYLISFFWFSFSSFLKFLKFFSHLISDKNKAVECFEFSLKWQIISVHRVLIAMVTRSQLILEVERVAGPLLSEGSKIIHVPFCKLEA